jgi:hypothetical protein
LFSLLSFVAYKTIGTRTSAANDSVNMFYDDYNNNKNGIVGCAPANNPDAAIQPLRSGLWNQTSIWPNGTLPTINDDVTVPAGITLTMVGTCKAKSVTVNGKLNAVNTQPAGAWINLQTESILITGAGALMEIGTEAQPYHATERCVITLVGAKINGAPGRYKGIMTENGGKLDLHGKKRMSWTNLSTTANAGRNSITLQKAVDWEVGDVIALTSTALASGATKSWENVDQATITAISADKKTISLAAPLKFTHIGGTKSYTRARDNKTWKADIFGEVGLLSHYIKIQSDRAENDAEGFGGHIMVMKNSTSYVEHVELYKMGQKAVQGRYPFHWHLAENTARGSYFRNSSVHKSFNRAVTIHGTDYITVDGIFAYDHIGHGIFLEDGGERFNTIQNNVVFVTRKPKKGEELTPSDNQFNAPQNRTPGSYWITNPNNIFINNVAAGTEGTGFWIAAPEANPLFASNTIPYYKGIVPFKEPLGKFDGFVVHTCMNGWDLFDQLKADHSINANWGWRPPQKPYFRNGIFYGNDQALYCGLNINGGLTNEITFTNCVFTDNNIVTMLAANLTLDNCLFNADAGLNVFNGDRTFYRIYDGPGEHINCHFEGWNKPNAYFLQKSLGGGATPNINIAFRGTTKGFPEPFRFAYADAPLNTRPVFLNKFLKDFDGSLLGKANTTLVHDVPFNTDGHEYRDPSWKNAARSDYNFATIWLVNLLGEAPPLSVVRSKPGTSNVCMLDVGSTNTTYKYAVICNKGFTYTYYLSKIPANKQIHIIMDAGENGDLALTSFKGMGNLQNFRVEGSGIAKVNSLAAVESATTNSYFVAANGDVYIKSRAIKYQRTNIFMRWDGNGSYTTPTPPTCSQTNPVVVKLNSAKQSLCVGEQLVLNASVNPTNSSQKYSWEYSTDGNTWFDANVGSTSGSWTVPSNLVGTGQRWWRAKAENGGFKDPSNILKVTIEQAPAITTNNVNICVGEQAKINVTGYDATKGCFDLADFYGKVDIKGTIGTPAGSSLKIEKLEYADGDFGTTYFDIKTIDNNKAGYIDYNYDFQEQNWSGFSTITVRTSFGGAPPFEVFILDANGGYTVVGKGAGGTFNLPADVTKKDNVTQVKLRFVPNDIGDIGASKRAHLSAITLCGNSLKWNTGETTASITKSPSATTNYSVTATYANCATTKTAIVNVGSTPNCTIIPPQGNSCPGTYDSTENGSFANAKAVPLNTDIKGLINSTTDNDYFKFTITTAGMYSITLQTVPADFDVRLYNSSQQRLGISEKPNTENEIITTELQPGTYFIHVYGWRGANSTTVCYTAKVAKAANGAKETANIEVTDKGNIKLYPIPANESITVFISNFTTRADISVYDMEGKLLISRQATQANTSLFINNLSKGVYVVKVKEETGAQYQMRFVKQ